ncbi:isochorismate hydrolase [Rhizobium mongolense]|uniref:Isochorismate hydrolase n=1 Tax=Rhizobium mongolense TaxID=57676 RepID=A0ABR6IXU7_9HYPH|nr:isochorismate hydrolase [Rhizobium mongolense]
MNRGRLGAICRHAAPMLQAQPVETLVITGGETDVCVMATTIDLGYRVICVEDAVYQQRRPNLRCLAGTFERSLLRSARADGNG